MSTEPVIDRCPLCGALACARHQAAREIADELTAMARNAPANAPIVWATGNAYMPPLRSFAQAEAVWQDDPTGERFAALVEDVEALCERANVCLDCPDYDNALYVVDTARFEHVDEPTGDNLSDEWRYIEPEGENDD